MRYPVYLYNISDGEKTYLIDFRDFHYQLTIYSQMGFSLKLKMGRRPNDGATITKDTIVQMAGYCLKWLDHLKGKITSSESGYFQYLEMKSALSVKNVAVADVSKVAFIYENQMMGGKETIKSLMISAHTTSQSVMFQPRRKTDGPTPKELQQWELLRSWEGIRALLRALLNDLEQKKHIEGFQSFSEQMRMDLSKICQRHGMRYQSVNESGRVGVRIAGKTFFNFKAAQHFIYSIIEERQQYSMPSYDIHLDRLIQ